MATVVNIDGRIVPAGEATVPVLDHGFLFGEGVYETLRTYGRRVLLFERHMARLRTSARMLALPVPFTDDDVSARVAGTVAAAGLPPGTEAYVRLLLTRGPGDISYDPASCTTPTFVVIVKPLVEPTTDDMAAGVRVSLVSVVRNHPAALNPLIKSNNLLNNAMAMQEALRRGAYEALMRNHRGDIAECSQSNFFIVRAGAVLTPPLEVGLLAGVTRDFIFEVGAAAGIAVEEAVLRDVDVIAADEAFLTSTTREILPVVRVDDHPIGKATPGPITRTLIETFRQMAVDRCR